MRVERPAGRVEDDWVVAEVPLEIHLGGEPLMVSMRTPGHDRELAAGFLFTEGVIDGPHHLATLEAARDPMLYDPDNVILVELAAEVKADPARVARARRELTSVAACGLCGKARIEDVYQRLPEIRPLRCPRQLLEQLPERMRPGQALFAATGGLHAAALFDRRGTLLALYEDVGRHNAVDKLIGHFLLGGELPLAGRILAVSSRAGFEVVQKAMMAAVPVLVAVGAASSLAVEMARQGGMELYSFVGPGRGNRHV